MCFRRELVDARLRLLTYRGVSGIEACPHSCPHNLRRSGGSERGMRTMRDAIFLIGKGRFLELLLFQPREQLRYNGVRKVRAVRTEEMALLLRKTAECCQT
jgi:hypothetical protein